MDIGTDERRVATEAVATLVNVKHVMFDFILKPAGVPTSIYRTVLAQVDETTGKALSKRKAAPLILDRLGPDGPRVVRRIIEIAARWPNDRFYLAHDEFEARATVQKAREVLGSLERMEALEAEKRAQETKQREDSHRAELARQKQEQAIRRRRELALLLMMFEDLWQSNDPQRRGFHLQELLTRLFDVNGIPVVRSFTRNDGGEQIDGAYQLEGWYYLVECRWREKLADIRQLDGLWGQINRSGRQTMGLFLSINGWSENVVPLLKQNPAKSILLMDGYDLRTVLEGRLDLHDFLLAKVAKLNLASEPFLSAMQFLQERSS